MQLEAPEFKIQAPEFTINHKFLKQIIWSHKTFCLTSTLQIRSPAVFRAFYNNLKKTYR